MEFGIGLPNMGPLATREAMFAMAERAEERGIESVWVGDHMAFPHNPRQAYPYSRGKPRPFIADTPLLDSLALMSAISGRCERVKIGVSVLILPYRHPLLTAKMVASMQEISGGRIILGVGVGWLSEEFEALGASFDERGPVSDEQILYLKELWYAENPSFKGKYYEFEDMTCLPRPSQKIPIWVGGNTKPAMRRAAKLGDGINFLDLYPDELEEALSTLHQVCDDVGRPFEELTLSARVSIRVTDAALEPSERKLPMTGSRAQVLEDLRRYPEMGIEQLTFSSRGRQDLASSLQFIDVVAQDLRPALS